MKANRSSILRDEDAVSPVIAVILMVAITVVLAATVFVLVSDIGQNTGKPPVNIAFDISETDDQASVTSSSVGVDWMQLQVRVDGGTGYTAIKFNLNALATGAAGTTLTNGTWADISATTNSVEVSDYLDFCATGAAGADPKIKIQDKEAGALIRELAYSSIALCA